MTESRGGLACSSATRSHVTGTCTTLVSGCEMLPEVGRILNPKITVFSSIQSKRMVYNSKMFFVVCSSTYISARVSKRTARDVRQGVDGTIDC